MKRITREQFYEYSVKPLVEDLIECAPEFRQKYGSASPFDCRYLRISSHRGVGHTYAGVNLLYDFPPSILFVPGFNMRTYLLKHQTYPLVDEKQVLIYEQALEIGKMKGVADRYKIAIIDVGFYLDRKNMRNTVLDALFNIWADYVVEFS